MGVVQAIEQVIGAANTAFQKLWDVMIQMPLMEDLFFYGIIMAFAATIVEWIYNQIGTGSASDLLRKE